MMTFAENLRRFRVERFLSQRELARQDSPRRKRHQVEQALERAVPVAQVDEVVAGATSGTGARSGTLIVEGGRLCPESPVCPELPHAPNVTGQVDTSGNRSGASIPTPVSRPPAHPRSISPMVDDATPQGRPTHRRIGEPLLREGVALDTI